MSQEFDLCFSNQTRAQLPVDTSDINEVRAFRKNNPHIIGNFIPAGTPFVLSQSDAKASLASRPDLACALSSVMSWDKKTQRKVSFMNQAFGDEQLHALAKLYETELQPYINIAREMTEGRVDSLTALGAGATALNAKEARLSNFGKAIFKYQTALIDVHNAAKSKANKTTLIKLGQKVKAAHIDLNKKFTKEIKHFSSKSKAGKRGNIWSSPERASNIARSSRNTSRLQLTSLSGIRSIRGLEFVSDVAGKGIIALDAGIRLDNVYKEYKAGENWQRTAAVEATGFGLGTAVGVFTGTKVITAGMGIALALGPVGWVILIGVGIGASYVAGKTADNIGKWGASRLHDTSESISWF